MNAPPPYGQQQPSYPQQPAYPPQPPPKKKGMSGCLLAALIVGGLFLVGAIGVAIFVVAFMRSDQGKKIVSAVSSGAQLMVEAQNAPGTSELRALGCQQAMVLDTEKLEQLAAQFGDAGVHAASGARLLVTCQAQSASKAPTCDQVASTYARAVGGTAAGEFEATVTVAGAQRQECSYTYDVEGARAKR